MNKKLIISLVMIGVLAFGAGLGSYAWFTSEAVSAANEFTSGTLDVNVDGNAADSVNMNLGTVDNLAPGDLTEFAVLTITNDGSLGAATFGHFTFSNGESNDGVDLADVLVFNDYKVQFYGSDGQPKDREDNFIENGSNVNAAFTSAYGPEVTLREWIDGQGPLDNTGNWDIEGMKPDEKIVITFRLRMDEDANNDYQDKSGTIGYEVKATQAKAQAIRDFDDTNLGTEVNEWNISYIVDQAN